MSKVVEMRMKNKKMRDALKQVEATVTATLAHQPEDDEKCSQFLYDALVKVYNIADLACHEARDKCAAPAVNGAKLREALEVALKTIRGVINSTILPRSNTVFDCRDKLSAALAAPPRNCDTHAADPDWKDICAKCKDGDIEPKHCKYYGEPNGCNSPIYGEHPTTENPSAVGNAAKLREALVSVKKSIDDMGAASLNGDPEVLLMSLTQVCARLSARIDAALAEPPRNCDMHTADELKDIFNSELVLELPIANEHEKNLVTITAMGVIDTLFAKATEGGIIDDRRSSNPDKGNKDTDDARK